jgi:glucose-6-phosphate isomerase
MLNWNIRSTYRPQATAKALQSTIDSYRKTVLSNPEIGFFHLPSNTELIDKTKAVYDAVKGKKYFVHIGIGGSALGPDMLLKALGGKTDVEFVFLNNIDPDDLARNLKKVNFKEALIYVVSKSGTTAETVAAMSICLKKLEDAGVKPEQYKEHFVFCTDPVKGDLRKLANEWGVKTLEVPSNVGGRFSVLTPVGFLPAMFAGIDCKKILQGAQALQSSLSDPQSALPFFELGAFIKELHDQGVHQTVMMPYSSLLKEFSAWFVQLWAESLGKEGKGLTPVPAYGATDQHSQMQLFMEGPKDKILFLIEVEKFETDFALKNSVAGESFKTLSAFSLGQLMKAELEGTLEALKENQRHVVHLKLGRLNEEGLGQLILFSECLTVLLGDFLKVDPFNQPGVEAGKKYAYAWLKNLAK